MKKILFFANNTSKKFVFTSDAQKSRHIKVPAPKRPMPKRLVPKRPVPKSRRPLLNKQESEITAYQQQISYGTVSLSGILPVWLKSNISNIAFLIFIAG